MNMVEQAPAVRTAESELTLDELRMELDNARIKWATLSSRRQNRMFERHNIHGYTDAKDEYNQLVIDYGRRELAETLEATADEDERKRTVVAYILEQQNALRELTDQTMESKRSRKFGRAIGKFLTSGSKKAQFAKGAILTGIAGATGGLVGVGAAGIGAVLFAKGYLTSEVKGMGRAEIDEAELLGNPDENEEPTTFEALLERAQMKSDKIFDADGKEQQVQRRRAAKRGLGVMATGLAFGGVIGIAADSWNMPSASATPDANSHTSPGMADTHANPGMFEAVNSTNPGMIDADTHTHTGPGFVDTQSHTSPGMGEPVVANHVSPCVAELTSTDHSGPGMVTAETGDTHSNPGMSGEASYNNPGMTEPSDTHTNPGMTEPTDAHTNPGMVDADAHTNPGMAEPSDTHTNPGMVDTATHTNPDMTEPTDTHTNPGMVDTDTHTNPDMAPDTATGFTVEHGNGYTHELMEAAAANGVDMTAEEAWAAHQVIVDQVGSDYIELTDHSGADTYSMGDTQYETGISAPGEATWSAEALELVHDATDDGEINETVTDAPQPDTSDVPATPDQTTPDNNGQQPLPDNTPDASAENGSDNAAEQREARIIERSGLEGLEVAEQDSTDWSEMQRDMNRMESLLLEGNFDAVNQNNAFQDTLGYIAHDADGMTYENSDVEILTFDTNTERWVLNPIPEGSNTIPSSVIELVKNYSQSVDKLAA